MLVIHGTVSMLWCDALLALWLLAVKCAAMSPGDMDRLLGEAVTKSLQRTPITVADAVAKMQIDESQFRRALRGEGYRLLALNHLVKLGPEFMVYLTAELMWLTAKQRATEIVETVNVLQKRA